MAEKVGVVGGPRTVEALAYSLRIFFEGLEDLRIERLTPQLAAKTYERLRTRSSRRTTLEQLNHARLRESQLHNRAIALSNLSPFRILVWYAPADEAYGPTALSCSGW